MLKYMPVGRGRHANMLQHAKQETPQYLAPVVARCLASHLV